jgi:hypothetical protein
MQTISSKFILDFKLGDNIVYNLKIAKTLYDHKEICRNELLNKPIILINTSIIEAIMYDFIEKIKVLKNEGVNLPDLTINYINDLKKTDKFSLIIDQFEKHKIIYVKDFDLIKSLRELSTLRNRIHIQNERGKLEPDDEKAFSKTRMIISEKVLEIILKVLTEKYKRRNKSAVDYVEDFVLPFGEHFEDLKYDALESEFDF